MAAARLRPGTLWDAVVERTAAALASGALQPIETRSEILEDGGVRFLTRVVRNLERKRLAKIEQGSDFDPFLHPEKELLVGEISRTHVAVLNKFNVVEHHLLLVTKAFEDQETLLTVADFEALAFALEAIDGLGFYNAGAVAGASQRHKHLQLVPAPIGEGPERTPMDVLLRHEPVTLGFAHALRRFDEERVFRRAPEMRALYLRLLAECGRENDPRAYNLLMTREWMLVVPRSREAWEGISVNALGFAGALLVRSEEELETLRRIGPMRLLREVTPFG